MESIPMPNTEHPAFSGVAVTVRGQVLSVIQVFEVSPRDDYSSFVPTADSSEATKRVTLFRKTFMAPAPFVGDPRINEAAYKWYAWIDDQGRHIAGDAELIWRYP